MKAMRIGVLGLVAAVALVLLTDGAPTRATDWCLGGVCQEWVTRYDGPVSGWDGASALVVDGAGNAYVTGFSEGIGTGSDYLTIKYDTNGKKEWEKRYNGPDDASDVAAAIALDGAGNVYVTGESEGSGTGSDYATVKYLADGTEEWVARYDEAAGTDEAYAIAVDGGYVYVTGSSEGVATGLDYATVKYDASNGNEVWPAAARYDETAGTDEAYAIALDGSGYVYVTGTSDGMPGGMDYATIKYDPTNGSEVWLAPARYDGPNSGEDIAYAIAVDGGYVYVTGSSEGAMTGQDYATIKYDATDGSEVWLAPARYDGPANATDEAYAIAVDGGYVYVTGSSEDIGTGSDYATIKYDATNGSEVWPAAARYDGPASGFDGAAALAVDGTTNLTKNPAADQMQAWSPDGSRIAFASNRDGNPEVYVMNADGTGQTRLTNNPAIDDGPAWSPDGSQIAFASYRSGDWEVYVMNTDGTAQTNLTTNPAWDIWPVWSPDGSQIAFVSDRDGNYEVYVMNADGTGQTNLTNNPAIDDWPVWSPDGSQIAFLSNRDGDGEVYVMNADGTAQTNLTGNPAEDFWPVWSPDGFHTAFVSDRVGNREIYVMNADGSEKVYVTGQSAGSGTNADYTTIKYLPDGTEAWVTRYDGPANGYDAAAALVLGSAGNVHVAGESAGSGTSLDYATVKYMADGDVDGFSDARETYLGTDPFDNCGLDAWPLDINNDTVLNLPGDVLAFIGNVGWINTDPGWTPAIQRLDLDGDTAVSSYGDVYSMYATMLGQVCNGGTPPPPPRPDWAPPVLMAIDPDSTGNDATTLARTEACVRIDVDPGDFGDGMADHSIDVFVKGNTQAPTTYDAWFFYEDDLVDPVGWDALIKLPGASPFTNDMEAVSRFYAGAAYLSGGSGTAGDGTIARVDLDVIGPGLASFDFAFARNAYWSVDGAHDLTTMSGSLALAINTNCNTDRALELLGAALVGDDWDDSVDADDDNDGFDDAIEVYLETEPLDNCPNWPPGPGGDAWPLDMDSNGLLNLGGDAAKYYGKIGCEVAVNPECKRLDLDGNGVINLGGDSAKYYGRIGEVCY